MELTPTPASSYPPQAAADTLPPPPVTSLALAAGDNDAGVGDREVVLPDLGSSVRWFQHGYPTPLARWHYHPEIEFHLILASHGQMMVGDQALDFAPGQVTLIGPNLPHNWLSDLGPGEYLKERDVLCQVLPERVSSAVRFLPEISAFDELVERARRGIVLSGGSAFEAANLLTAIGKRQGLGRLTTFFSLVELFLSAPNDEWHHIVSESYIPGLNSVTASHVNEVLAYIEDNLEGEVSMKEVAQCLGMSPSSFSRFFHSTTGITFSALVRRRRIARACYLLRRTSLSISRVADLSGYSNLANFNRRFRDETGMTPSSYRKMSEATFREETLE